MLAADRAEQDDRIEEGVRVQQAERQRRADHGPVAFGRLGGRHRQGRWAPGGLGGAQAVGDQEGGAAGLGPQQEIRVVGDEGTHAGHAGRDHHRVTHEADQDTGEHVVALQALFEQECVLRADGHDQARAEPHAFQENCAVHIDSFIAFHHAHGRPRSAGNGKVIRGRWRVVRNQEDRAAEWSCYPISTV
ncbi:hypothetical protein D3C87_801930 [compost metagenome]